MRHGIGRAGGEIDRGHTGVAKLLKQSDRLRKIDPRGVVCVDAKPAVIGERIREGPRLAVISHLVPRHAVEEREPDADREARRLRPHPCHERSQESRAASEVAAEAARSPAGGKKLMHEIAMAGLEVDHVEPGRLGIAGGRHVAVDEPFDIVVRQYTAGVLRVDVVPCVEQRMVIRDPRLPAGLRRLGKPSRVRELDRHHEIIVRSIPRPMGLANGGHERAEPAAAECRGGKLVRVRAAFRKDGHGLPAPNQFCTAQAEVSPAAEERVGRQAVGGGIPALHRMDAPAVAGTAAADGDRRGQRRALGRVEHGVVKRNRRCDRRAVRPQVVDRAKAGDAGKVHGWTPRHSLPQSGGRRACAEASSSCPKTISAASIRQESAGALTGIMAASRRYSAA